MEEGKTVQFYYFWYSLFLLKLVLNTGGFFGTPKQQQTTT